MLHWISNDSQRSRFCKVSDLAWKKPRAYWAWFRIKNYCSYRVIHWRPRPDTGCRLPERRNCRYDFIDAGHRMNSDAANHLIFHFRVCEPSFSLHGDAFAYCFFGGHLICPMSFWSSRPWIHAALLNADRPNDGRYPERREACRSSSGRTLMQVDEGRVLMCFWETATPGFRKFSIWKKGRPYFLYLRTNAPHGCYRLFFTFNYLEEKQNASHGHTKNREDGGACFMKTDML